MGILLVYDVTDESSFNSKFFLLLVLVLRHSSFIISSTFLIFYNACFFKSKSIRASFFVGKHPVLKCVLRWNWLLYLFHLTSRHQELDSQHWAACLWQCQQNISGEQGWHGWKQKGLPHTLTLCPSFWFSMYTYLLWLLCYTWCWKLFSLGCSDFKGSSSGRRIWHQVFWNCKQHFLVVTLVGKAFETAVLFLMPRLCLCRAQKLIWMWRRFSFQ